jgi:hypothetical protein
MEMKQKKTLDRSEKRIPIGFNALPGRLQSIAGLMRNSISPRRPSAAKKNGRKERKKESGVVGAGLKPALSDLAHREICASRANHHG